MRGSYFGVTVDIDHGLEMIEGVAASIRGRVAKVPGLDSVVTFLFSFSQRHTKKVWKPNLQSKTVLVDGKKVRLRISTQAIRTLKKKGLITK